ncbi:LysR family transcriptional regulator [Streptococcus equinus]|nr:LysR family transcriptional regulator [Streptococcus equinus]
MISKYAIFCLVIELGSFTKAAQQLNYSQSAISQTIKNLEKEIGLVC